MCDSQNLGCLPRAISSWIFRSEVVANKEFETKSSKFKGEFVIFFFIGLPFFSITFNTN